ncbi:MAG: Xaa-Pro peptidase family protein [Acidimicrobiia bacterium]|nr:MAG: Xaa-Pro peptidase family protein [Acidimicrobiia bacterium]
MNEFRDRIARAQTAIRSQGLDALCVSIGSDLPYLTGYRAMPLERITMFVVPADGRATLVVPGLEASRVDVPDNLFDVREWAESDRPIAIIDRLLGEAGAVAIGDETWSRFLLQLQEADPRRSFVPASDLMATLRIRKSRVEIDALREAAGTVDAVVDEMSSVRFSGRSERDISREIIDRTIAGGHDSMDFWIVASGPNGASPHHEPRERIVQHGDAVVVDFGGHQGGYCSDTTRMFVVGEPPHGFDEAFDVLRSAQAAAVDAVQPGVSAGSLDTVAREIIAEAGYGELFIHRLGHGIGMDAHEHPYLIEGNAQIIESGMAFSIEPGIYVQGQWGMRIEDIVTVTDDGVERLNQSDRDYRVVA